MIGPASSKYFEGLLFVLVRRPYGIGDCIHVSSINENTDSTGSGWWLVEDVNLFTTSVMYIYTQERATMSNGSLANSRIINSSRSSAANLFVLIKFPIDVPYVSMLRGVSRLTWRQTHAVVCPLRKSWYFFSSQLSCMFAIILVNGKPSWHFELLVLKQRKALWNIQWCV